MNRFTIDVDFISFAGMKENFDLLFNVLMVFIQDNEFRLCLDSSNIALAEYNKIALESEAIRFWFKCLFETEQSRRYIDYIKIEKQKYSHDKQIYIEICNCSYSKNKRIIVANKQSYGELMDILSEKQINLLDGYEAKSMLNTRVMQISYGNNSPNINGNNNIVKK